jgi:hypothetical protein
VTSLRLLLPFLVLAACAPNEPPLLFVNKQALAFGTVEVNGGTYRQPVAISNVGDRPLRITTLRLETDSGELELWGTPVEQLEPMERRALAVRYTPTNEGNVSGVLHLEANDGQGPRELPVRGLAGRLAAELHASGAERCGTTPSSLDFGTVTNGAPAVREFTVLSTGTAPISVLKASLTPDDAGFVVSGPFGQPLAPGGAATFRVTYDPRLPGAQAVAVTLTTSSVLQPKLTVSLCGIGRVEALCVTPRELDLGAVTSGTTATASLRVTSCGNLPVTVRDVSLTQVNGMPGFSLPSPPTIPRVMPEGDSFDVDVRFVASSALSARSLVRVQSSSAVTPSLDVPVGANLPPPCSVSISPNPLTFFNVVPAAPLRITNQGARDCVMQRLTLVQSGSSFTLERDIELPAVLPAHASMEVPLRYTPGGAPESAKLELEFDFVRAVQLRGDPAPPPGCRLVSLQRQVDFGLLPPGVAGSASVTLLNAGRDSCLLTSATTDQPTLSVELPQQELESQRALTLDVRYTPSPTVPAVRGTLTVSSNDGTRPELVLPVFAGHTFCDPDCQCTDDETLAHWRFSAGFVGSNITDAGGAKAIRRSCEPRRCAGNAVLVEVGRGDLECAPPPPVCADPEGLDYVQDGWQCVPCELIVQFGGLFDGLRACAPRPNLTCAAGQAPTFDATTHTWDCAKTCNNGLYDQHRLYGQLVCVPC